MPQVVRNISISPQVDAAIARRAKARGESFSRTVDRLFEESEGNCQLMRHDLRQPVNAIGLHLAALRKQISASVPAQAQAALRETIKLCEDGLDEIAQRLIRRETTASPPTAMP